MKLSITKMTFVAAMIIVVIAATGCETKSAYQHNAEQRWQKTLEQAKLDYAQQYIEQGRYVQAKAILEPMVSDANDAKAEILLAKVEERQSQYATALQTLGR